MQTRLDSFSSKFTDALRSFDRASMRNEIFDSGQLEAVVAESTNLAQLNINLLRAAFERLFDRPLNYELASGLRLEPYSNYQERAIAITKHFGADDYVNSS